MNVSHFVEKLKKTRNVIPKLKSCSIEIKRFYDSQPYNEHHYTIPMCVLTFEPGEGSKQNLLMILKALRPDLAVCSEDDLTFL